MTNADTTARVLSALAALGFFVYLTSLARALTTPGPRPTRLLSSFAISLGLLVYATGRVFSGPEGRALSVDIVAGALFLVGTIGNLRANMAAQKRDAEGGSFETLSADFIVAFMPLRRTADQGSVIIRHRAASDFSV